MSHHPLARVSVPTQSRCQLVDVTTHVQLVIRENRITEGYVIIYSPHTTAGVTINENADPDVKSDMLKKLEEMIPKRERYYDHAEGNSDSHVKTSLVGNSVTVLVDNGRLLLGQWQGIYFAEFDGPREREMLVKVVDLNPRRDD